MSPSPSPLGCTPVAQRTWCLLARGVLTRSDWSFFGGKNPKPAAFCRSAPDLHGREPERDSTVSQGAEGTPRCRVEEKEPSVPACVSVRVCRWFCFFLNNISVSRLAVTLAHSFCRKASLNGKRIIYTDIKHLYLDITIYIKEVGLLSPYQYGVVEALLLVYKLFLALLLIYLTSRARLGVSRFMLC